MTTMEIVKSVSIQNMTNQRDAVMCILGEVLDLLKKAETVASAANLGFPRIAIQQDGKQMRITGACSYTSREDIDKECARIVDKDGWQYLMNESGMRSFMDATAREKWDNQLYQTDIPALTMSNVQATFSKLYEGRHDMFERGIIECFRSLSWNYRTNQPFKFGKRIIIRNMLNCGYPNHGRVDRVDDLMRVFCMLDQKPIPDHRNGIYAQISHARQNRETSLENEYLTLKWYANGNCHVTFKRIELVEKMNKVLAKHYPHALANTDR